MRRRVAGNAWQSVRLYDTGCVSSRERYRCRNAGPPVLRAAGRAGPAAHYRPPIAEPDPLFAAYVNVHLALDRRLPG